MDLEAVMAGVSQKKITPVALGGADLTVAHPIMAEVGIGARPITVVAALETVPDRVRLAAHAHHHQNAAHAQAHQNAAHAHAHVRHHVGVVAVAPAIAVETVAVTVIAEGEGGVQVSPEVRKKEKKESPRKKE